MVTKHVNFVTINCYLNRSPTFLSATIYSTIFINISSPGIETITFPFESSDVQTVLTLCLPRDNP